MADGKRDPKDYRRVRHGKDSEKEAIIEISVLETDSVTKENITYNIPKNQDEEFVVTMGEDKDKEFFEKLPGTVIDVIPPKSPKDIDGKKIFKLHLVKETQGLWKTWGVKR